MKKMIAFILALAFAMADDMCYESLRTDGFMCFDVGPCGGGIGCKKIYPIKNMSNSTLENVKIYYNEDGLKGSAWKNCGTNPDGKCKSVDSLDFGPFGFFNTATEFKFNENMVSSDEFEVWVSNLISGQCFSGDRLYAEYDKNGIHYRVKLHPCLEAKKESTSFHNDYAQFKLIHRENIFGNIISVGNTNECVTAKKAVNNLADLKRAKCENNIAKYYNNYYMTKYINVLDSNYSIFNSSSATVKFPKTFKRIKYAAIFWQGHVNNYSYKFSNTRRRKKSYDKYYYDRATSGKDKNKIFYKWRKKNGGYYYNLSNDLPGNSVKNIEGTSANEIVAFFNGKSVRLIAKELDYKNDSRKFKDKKNKKYIIRNGVKYSAYTEIDPKFLNSLVKNNELNVTVANIYSTYGLDFRLGDYAGWSLVIIYEEDSQNPDSKLRSNSVYYGFQSLSSGKRDLNIKIDKLLLPRYGKVDSKLSIFTAEGEYKVKGSKKHPESVKVNGTLLSNYYKEIKTKDGKVILKDYDNKYNVMDSILSNFDREPFLVDNNGIDIDNFDVTNAMTNYRDTHEAVNNEYDVNIHLSTYKDGYYVSEISFSNELYQPRVCYYIDTITDLNGDVVYKNGKFVKKLNSLKDYNISFWIANMKQNEKDNRIDTAQNVKLTLQYNNFEYLNNSTYVKNIGDVKFKHISDEINDDIGEFLSDKNQTLLRIGRNASVSEGGIIPPTFNFNNKSRKVFVNISGRFIANTNKEINLDDYLQYYASFQTPYINISEPISIPKCKKFNTRGEIYRPSLGTFNVVNDKFSGNIDPVDSNNKLNALYTQIINKPFDVKILHLGDDKKTVEKIPHATLMLEVVDASEINSSEISCKNAKSLYSVPNIYTFINKSEKDVKNLNIPLISKNATFRIKYIDWDKLFAERGVRCSNNGLSNKLKGVPVCLENRVNLYKAFPGNLCINEEITGAPCLPSHNGVGKGKYNNAYGCMRCLLDYNASYVCARDNFAIRPDKFEITDIPAKVKAGEEFNITLRALDFNGKVVKDYNESIGDSYYDSLSLISKILKSGCKDGKLRIVSGKNFSDGLAKVTLVYDEVGEVNVTLKEKPSKEFAMVDEDDTDDENRLIKKYEAKLLVVPDYFKIEGKLNNYTKDFTYLSKDLNMSAVLALNITAKAKDGKTTQNYNNECYADNIKIVISKKLSSSPKTLSSIEYVYKNSYDKNSSLLKVDLDKNITITNYSKDNFTTDNNGSANLTLYINFDKNYSSPETPFDMEISEVDVINKDVNESNSIVSGKAVYKYGRIYTPEISGYGSELNTTFKYQYWDDKKGWVDNTDHNKELGSIDLKNSYVNNVLLNNSQIRANVVEFKDGNETIKFKTLHSLPYGAKVHLAIPSWLWYHPLAKDYKNPSPSNLNCLTHPCTKVNFLSNSAGWGGVETNSKVVKKEFNVSKRTVDVNSSKSDVSKKEVKKINW